jgi:hypothetical protein
VYLNVGVNAAGNILAPYYASCNQPEAMVRSTVAVEPTALGPRPGDLASALFKRGSSELFIGTTISAQNKVGTHLARTCCARVNITIQDSRKILRVVRLIAYEMKL